MPTVAFDANGTLFELTPVSAALGGDVPLEAFFQRVLHTAAALTAIGSFAPFDEIAAAALATTCAKLGLDIDQEAVLAALQELPAAEGAAEAVELAGPCAIVTNGGEASTRALVERNGLSIERVVSAEAVRAYKPAAAVYEHARAELGEFVLVAAHAWDVAGARACGLRAVWLDRSEREWPLAGLEPGERASSLVEAVRLARSDGG